MHYTMEDKIKSDIIDLYLITSKAFIEPKTAVIYDFSCNPPEVFSGTFARTDDKFFVITCAHSMKHMTKNDIRIQRKKGIITLDELLVPKEIKTLNISSSLDIGIIFLNKEDLKGVCPAGGYERVEGWQAKRKKGACGESARSFCPIKHTPSTVFCVVVRAMPQESLSFTRTLLHQDLLYQ